ncbi:non-ribosomal peptide synthetase, partial [Virgisporangium aurantiacum]|uniref:non-ribosomal peptide synthetase n=1 Tax=Virgisporangium aurantiacum TaxID=175570 RepID=UPI00195148EF
TWFTYGGAPVDAVDSGQGFTGLTVGELPVRVRTAKFDLALSIGEAGPCLAGSIQYAADVFDDTTIQRMTRHLGAILAEVAADPTRRIRELAMVTAEETEQVLRRWNATTAEIPPASVHGLASMQAARRPDTAAVVAGDDVVTYRDLDQRAEQLARYLRDQGIGPECVVGVRLPRGPELVVAMLGVLKAGGVYLPLDPDDPEQRQHFILSDAGAALVCTPQTLEAAAAASTQPVPIAAARADHAAYVIYTSGSAGVPKGVVTTHGALANSTAARTRRYERSPGTFLLLSPVAFDSSLAGLFWTLCTGGTLVTPAPRRELDPADIATDVNRYGVTHLLATPSLLAQLFDWCEGHPDHPLHTLRTIISAGEACPPELAHRCRSAVPAARLFNEYGPTEATVWASMAPADGTDGDRAPPIGTPIANTTMFVLDRSMTPVPVGVPGELHIGGAGLARGYTGRPELTAQRFVADPFGAPGSRLYRTGDRVRWRADGQLEFLGRLDDQLKVRAYRVEAAEVSSALNAHPEVDGSAVGVRPDPHGHPRLIAWFTAADPAAPPTATELSTHLATRLPAYMVPTAFVRMAALPLTDRGKIDSRALPDPDGARAEPAGTYVPPRTPTEHTVAGIWAELLGIDRVGIHDNFFTLGGHSLIANRVVARVRSTLGVDLAVAALFEAPTVAGLAVAVEDAGRDELVPPVVPVPRTGG